MRRGVVWVQLERPPILPLRRVPVPLKDVEDAGQGGVRLSEPFVEVERLERGFLCPRHHFRRRQQVEVREQAVTVGESGIGEGVAAVFADGLLEVRNRLAKTLFGHLVPVVTPS